MVSIKSFLTTSAVIIATFATVEAAVAPSFPQPGTVETEGQAFDITWTFDGKNASATYQIDFMTGSNSNQTVLANVAKGVKGDALKYNFVAPSVEPNSAVYFFMFTGSDGSYSWTTRFGIVKPGGALTAEPEKTQPTGEAIPWGNGQIVSSSVAASNATTVVTTAAPAAEAASVSASASGVSAVASPSTSAAKVIDTSAGSTLKPVLATLASVGAAAYFCL